MPDRRSLRAPPPAEPVLPDVLPPGLALVFCGTAAGRVSAAAGAYYANRGNAFWRTLAQVGLTPRPLAPAEFLRLPDYGIGLTDLAKHHVGNDDELPREAFDAAALRRRVLAAAPRWLAFTSKNAAQAYHGEPVAFGEQRWRIGTTRVFVLPSPSGQARRSWDVAQWAALAERVRAGALQPITLRRAGAADVPGILALEALFPTDRISPRGLRRLLRVPSARIWVAVGPAPQRAVLGALVLLTRSGSGVVRIYSLAVSPPARGLGLAKALVQRAERAARRDGKHSVSLEVRADNAAARVLYARLGYVERARLPRYYEDGSDGLRLRRRLVATT